MCDALKHVETVKIGEVSFPILPPLVNGLLLLSHAAFHLNSSKLGLRQVIDWMMFVHSELDDTKWEGAFRLMAYNAGLERFAIYMTRLCRDYLGLPGAYNWCDAADKQSTAQLLELILERGNFGRKLERPHGVENITAKVKDRGFVNYLWQIGAGNWRSLKVQESVAILKPFIWLSEFIKLVNSRLIASHGHIKEEYNRGRELAELYKKIGLR